MAAPFQSSPHHPPIINQQTLVKLIRDRFENFTDIRTGKNSQYAMSDAALSAFAVFFLQNPSFLAQQITSRKTKAKIICKPCLARIKILATIRFVNSWMSFLHPNFTLFLVKFSMTCIRLAILSLSSLSTRVYWLRWTALSIFPRKKSIVNAVLRKLSPMAKLVTATKRLRRSSCRRSRAA